MDRLLGMSVFVAAIEEGSIAAAARRHGLSSVMAGRYLAALEDAVPARLVERTTRRLSLTATGTAYYARCKRILEEYEEANTEAAESHASPRGSLRIAAPITFGAMFLGPLVAEFMQLHPEVNVSVHLHDRFVDLVEEGMDLALRVGRLEDSSLVVRAISRCSLVACASPSYLESHGVPRTPEELLRHRRIGYIGTTSTPPWTFTNARRKTTSLDQPCRFTANSSALMLRTALAHGGIAYGPSFVFADELASGRLVQVLPDHESPTLPIHVVTPTAKHVTRKARLFSDQLVRAFGGDPPWERWRRRSSSSSRRRRGR